MNTKKVKELVPRVDKEASIFLEAPGENVRTIQCINIIEKMKEMKELLESLPSSNSIKRDVTVVISSGFLYRNKLIRHNLLQVREKRLERNGSEPSVMPK